ncbi:MAG: histidine kinase [Eubacterium sp.]|nr:histidine kinase [Eubacterium sp.]
MDLVEGVITSLDYILNTKRKRHITGGILLSTSLFLGGLAVTVMTIKNEVNEI